MIRSSIEITTSDLEMILEWYHVCKDSTKKVSTLQDTDLITKLNAILISAKEDEREYCRTYFRPGGR